MSRTTKPNRPAVAAARPAQVELATMGDAALVSVSGLVDERFLGFGDVGSTKSVVLNVSGMTRMTSFGVRQWIKAIEALPKSISNLYLLGCPTFFVDQLNMVLNFGGPAAILTVVAPYRCPSCDLETSESIDVLAERADLAKGGLPEKTCTRCNGKLEFDETPESYFAFLTKYAASSIQADAAQMLAAHKLYTSAEGASEKPVRIIKLVHGSVTYFRIIGTIGSMFRARPFLVGAEGEVVIDLAEVDRFDVAGQKEWRRLLKSLAPQVPSVTLVDVNESFLTVAGDTFTLARNISVASVLVPYLCVECGRTSHDSTVLDRATWPIRFAAHVCTTCGGTTQIELAAAMLDPLQKASTSIPQASSKVIAQRAEILSRALTDANVAQAGEGATAAVSAETMILGKYKIISRLSAGGMAEVFLANQVGIGGFEKPVALKRIQRKLLETRHQAIELFLNEAKIAGRLMHPNIVQVLDVGEVGGALYLAMEYVHGKDLRNIVKKLQQNKALMPLGEALYIVREVAHALHHAYWSVDMTGKRLSVVHRDISPHNIILGYDGAVKLLDFGVAMSAVTEHAETIIVGKWLYMSPETTTNQPIDHRSDLFSLGVILYLLCSGTMPFTGSDPKEIVKKIRAGQYKPLHEIVSIPDQLTSLIKRMLSPNPADRPQRGQDVATELTEIARGLGIESSGPSIAAVIAQLFPDDGAADRERTSREMVRVVPEELGGSQTGKSPVSVTSLSNSKGLAPIDVSQTYQRRSGEYGTQVATELSSMASVTPVPSQAVMTPPRGLPTVGAPTFSKPVLQHQPSDRVLPTQPRSPSSSSLKIVILLVLILAVVAVAAYRLG